MKCNLAYFIASDAHDFEARPFMMKSLFKEEVLLDFRESMMKLIKNAEAIIKNEEIDKREPLILDIQKIKGWIF